MKIKIEINVKIKIKMKINVRVKIKQKMNENKDKNKCGIVEEEDVKKCTFKVRDIHKKNCFVFRHDIL